MSVDAFSALPLQAGQAVAAAAGRTAMWVIAAYMRAPLRNTAIAALTAFSAMAGSNALYNQSAHHPAPLFGTFEHQASESKAAKSPAMPLQRPAKLMTLPSPETTGSVAPAAVAEPVAVTPIGNEDVFEIQRKLTAFKLFDGKVDGLYGPRTARAIKAFEASIGQPQKGELTPAIVELIKSTPITAEPAKLELAPAPVAEATTSEPAAQPALELAVTEEPLPAPQPLAATTESATVEQVAAIEPEPQIAALEPTVDETGVSTLEMTSPAEPAANSPTKRSVQTIAIRATAPAEATIDPAVQQPVIDVVKASTDPKVVGAVQRGLASLGFLHGEIDGVAGEATAKAIRNFEVYYNYNVTGRITPELVNLLVQNGAVI
jgi:peptidoglycan hydrolase-like protein with peptidoglycan-binding domain